MQPSRGIVLTLGLSQQLEEEELFPFRVVQALDIESALRVLTAGNVAALLIGPHAPVGQVLDFLAHLASAFPQPPIRPIVLCADPELEWQKIVDEGRVFYIVRGEIGPRDLRPLITGGAHRAALIANPNLNALEGQNEKADRILDLCVRMSMQTELASAGRLLIEAAREVLQTEVVECFVYDLDAETLSPIGASNTDHCRYSAASGLVAYVARSGESICLDRVGGDSRYDCDIDAPLEMRNARFIAEPIMDLAGTPRAVLSALRSSEQVPFGVQEIRWIRALAECSAPTFGQIMLQDRVQALLAKRAEGIESQSGIFRQEALEFRIRRWDQQGNVLAVMPAWLRRAFWLVLVLFSASLVGLAFLSHHFAKSFGKAN